MEARNKIIASVGILTLNSEATLERALESVKDFDQIIVCDGNSTDRTIEIARRYGATIIKQHNGDEPNQSLKDFAAARNKCLDIARNDWFLYVDSDEAISLKLRQEIGDIVSRAYNQELVYRIPNLIIYKDKEILHSTSYPGYQTRFFNKKSGARFVRPVHERIEFNPAILVGTLKGPWHVYISDEDYRESWRDIRNYAAIEVKASKQQTLGQFLYWSVAQKLFRLVKLVLRAGFMYLRFGFRDSLPPKFELQRLSYTAYLLYSLVKSRIT